MVLSQLNLQPINVACLTPSALSFILHVNHTLQMPTTNPPPKLSSFSYSEEDVHQLIKSLPSKTASGPDNISKNMLKGAVDSVALQLLTLFNLSLSSGCIPSDWKISNVTPIFKAGDPKLVLTTVLFTLL